MKFCKVNGSYEIWLTDHRADRKEWYEEAGWEKARLESIRQSIKRGDIMLYVGSEESEMPCLCQMWGSKVIMIEPNFKVWPNGKAIWEANKLAPPLACFVGFAGDVTVLHGEKIIYNGFPECANGKIISDHGFCELQTNSTLPRIKIDDLVEMSGLIPKHISIDCEGSERLILEGAKETLKKYRPNIWLSAHPELMMLHFNQYLGDLRRWIMDIGYRETLLEYPLHEIHFYYEAI